MRVFKWKMALVISAAFTLMLPTTAFARDRIEEISLNFSADLDSGDTWPEMEITPDDDGYMVEDFQFDTDSTAKYPEGTVTLVADDDYYFGTIKRSDCTLSGEGAYFSNVIKDSSRKIRLVVSFREMGDGEVDMPESLVWGETGEISWEPVSGARSYQLRLMRGGKTIDNTTVETAETAYDFSSKITETGTYSVRIRAVSLYNSSVYSEWVTSPGFSVDSARLELIQTSSSNSSSDGSTTVSTQTDNSAITPGQWQWFSSQNAWYWQNPDGTYAYEQWIQTASGWYYTGSDGHLVTGWRWIKGSDGLSRCYYFSTTSDETQGRMYTNATTPDGYTVNSNGAWTVNGTVQIK